MNGDTKPWSSRTAFLILIAVAVIVILLAILSGWCQAASLVCDPYPADSQPTHYTMKVDGVAVTTPYGTMVSGASLVLSLDTLDLGKHLITDIKACNERGCSDPPLAFTVPAIPSKPSSIRIGF